MKHMKHIKLFEGFVYETKSTDLIPLNIFVKNVPYLKTVVSKEELPVKLKEWIGKESIVATINGKEYDLNAIDDYGSGEEITLINVLSGKETWIKFTDAAKKVKDITLYDPKNLKRFKK